MQQYADVVTDPKGNVVPGARVSILKQDGTLASLFDNDGVTPIGNPVTTDPLGGFTFRAASGVYRRRVTIGASSIDIPGEIILDTPGVSVIAAAGYVYPEQYASLQLAIAAAAGKTLVLNGAYTVDNSAADGLTVGVDNITIAGTGTISFTSIAHNGLRVTGQGVKLSQFTVRGPGTFDTSSAGAVSPGLVYIDGSGRTSAINCTLDSLKVFEPGKMGIVVYKAVGVDIIKPQVENSQPVATWAGTSNNHLIRIYSSAYVNIDTPHLRGFAEGIVVGAYPSTDYVFDDFHGSTSNKARHIKVWGGSVTGQYDHAGYFSNDCEYYDIHGVTLWPASDAEGGEGTAGLKLEGGYFSATENIVREGIQLRNPYNAKCNDNRIFLYSGRGTANNPSKFGILAQDVIFQRNLEAMEVDRNLIYVVGNIEVNAAIQMQGAVWSGYQSQIRNLSMCGNKAYGVGRMTVGNGFGFVVHQDMPLDGSGHVTGAIGIGVKVRDNVAELASFTGYASGCGSYGLELLNLEQADVGGNTFRNFTLSGINELGVQNSLFAMNTLAGNPAGSTQRFGIVENSADLTLHVATQNNTYGVNKATNVDYKYFLADETSQCADLAPLLNLGAANSNQSVAAYNACRLVIWSPTTASLTLTFSTLRPWGIGQEIVVLNKGSQSFTVANTSNAIAPGNSLKFICTGSNTFIAY
jgi:hypothetical protein